MFYKNQHSTATVIFKKIVKRYILQWFLT